MAFVRLNRSSLAQMIGGLGLARPLDRRLQLRPASRRGRQQIPIVSDIESGPPALRLDVGFNHWRKDLQSGRRPFFNHERLRKNKGFWTLFARAVQLD